MVFKLVDDLLEKGDGEQGVFVILEDFPGRLRDDHVRQELVLREPVFHVGLHHRRMESYN